MCPSDAWGEGYLRLGLRLERHFPGYVDAYYGPEDLRKAISEEEPLNPAALAQEAVDLRRDLPRQGYAAERITYLDKQLRAMETVARKIAGESFSYREEVECCFDIKPQLTPEETFQQAHAQLEQVLPGEGSLRERLQTHRDHFILTNEQVLPLIQLAQEELRLRTRQLVSLPEGEEVRVTLVRNQPWTAYNWYRGNYRSLIEVNTDLPSRAHNLLEIFSHEAYPGHHTEAVLKEHLLYRGQSYVEQAIALLNSPENVIAEGIANVGVKVIFDDAERIRWKNGILYPQAGLDPVDVEFALRLEQATRSLRYVSANAALLLHEQNWPPERVVDYLERYTLRTREESEHMLRFLQAPLSRAYIFCYATGQDLIEAAMAQVDDKPAFFRRLLTEQWTPSALVEAAENNPAE